MDNDKQLIFDFSSEIPEKKKAVPEAPAVDEAKINSRSMEQDDNSTVFAPLFMKRAVMAWLQKQKPACIGTAVPTRFSRYQADVAAFWARPSGKFLKPEKTIIVELRHQRELCWPDCSNQEQLLPLLRKMKGWKDSIQKEIRQNEPHLRDSDTLFEEFESWDYSGSENQDYHNCCRRIEEIEHALYKGSRFEQIRQAHVADLLLLAVPFGSVHPHELADGWGLLYVKEDMNVDLIREPDSWDCPEKNKLHLVQNIAISVSKSHLFAHGIQEKSDGKVYFTPIPRRRRPNRGTSV
jgi:hypothetical protein